MPLTLPSPDHLPARSQVRRVAILQNLCFRQELFLAYGQVSWPTSPLFQLHFLPVGLQVTLAQGGKTTGTRASKEAVSESKCLHPILCLQFSSLIFFLLIQSTSARTPIMNHENRHLEGVTPWPSY